MLIVQVYKHSKNTNKYLLIKHISSTQSLSQGYAYKHLSNRKKTTSTQTCLKSTQAQTHKHTNTQTHKHTNTSTPSHHHTITQSHKHSLCLYAFMSFFFVLLECLLCTCVKNTNFCALYACMLCACVLFSLDTSILKHCQTKGDPAQFIRESVLPGPANCPRPTTTHEQNQTHKDVRRTPPAHHKKRTITHA